MTTNTSSTNAEASNPTTTTTTSTLLEELAPGVWVRQIPFRFLGLIHVGARMTVLRLGEHGGGSAGAPLVIHSPIPITPELKAEVDALGTVRFIVAPSLFHHVYASDAARAWPDAKVLAPAKLRRKRGDLKIDAELEAGAPMEWEGAIDLFPIQGCMLGETVFYHRASKTLVSADLFENFVQPVEHGLTRAYLKLGGIHGKPGWHRLMRVVYRDRKAAKASLEPIVDLDLQRIVIAHGDVVTTRPRETLTEALHFLFA